MFVLSIVLIILGLSSLYILLFKFERAGAFSKRQKEEHQSQNLGLIVTILSTLGGGVLILLEGIIWGFNPPLSLNNLTAQVILVLKILIPFIFLIGGAFYFFPTTRYNNSQKSGELIKYSKEKYIKKTKRIGLILILVSLLLGSYFFILPS